MIAGMEPASADMCFYMMTVITIVKPIIWVPAFIPPYGLRAAGDVKFSMILSTCFYVDLPCESVYLSCRVAGIWTDRGVDRHVYRLDDPWNYLYNTI